MPRIPADMTYSPTYFDRVADAGRFKFYTSAGWLTPYALSCGYVMRRGTDESGATLQALPSAGAGYVVHGTGRWIRLEATRTFHYLRDARRYFASLDHVALSESIRAAFFTQPAAAIVSALVR